MRRRSKGEREREREREEGRYTYKRMKKRDWSCDALLQLCPEASVMEGSLNVYNTHRCALKHPLYHTLSPSAHKFSHEESDIPRTGAYPEGNKLIYTQKSIFNTDQPQQSSSWPANQSRSRLRDSSTLSSAIICSNGTRKKTARMACYHT